MIFGSVCSGIEAASAAWAPLGWKAAWFSEIEKFPCAVLAHHHPEVPNLGDMTRIHEDERFKTTAIDLLCGGTPCQSFSVAGLRKGMEDPRGNLALVFLRIAALSKPRWIVWENVPGVLSSNGGRDFASFLTALGQLGYGWSYRVLDAQYVGGCSLHGRPPVPQRRRRVFVVGYLGDWRRAAAVLLESDCMCRNTKKSRKKGKGVTEGVGHSLKASGGFKQDHTHETYIPDTGALAFDRQSASQYGDEGVASTVQARDYKSPSDLVVPGDAKCLTPWPEMGEAIRVYDPEGVAPPIKPHATNILEDELTKPSTYSTPAIGNIVPDDVASTITKNTGGGGETQNPAFVLSPKPVCFEQRSQDGVPRIHGDISPTLNRMGGGQREPCVVQPIAFQANGDRDNPGLSISETAFTIPANPMSDRGQAVLAPAPIILEDQGGSCINVTDDGIVGTLRSQSKGHEPCVIAPAPQPMMFDPYNNAVSEMSPSLGTNCGMPTGRNIAITPNQTTLSENPQAFYAECGSQDPQKNDNIAPPLLVKNRVAVAFTQNSRSEVREIGGDGQVVGALAAQPGAQQQNYIAFTQNQAGDVLTGDVTPSMGTNANASGRNTPKIAGPLAYDRYNDSLSETAPTVQAANSGRVNGVVAPTLTASNDPSRSPQSSEVTNQVAAVQKATMSVRRLTPEECEALQGFPRGHTKIPWRKKGAEDCPDGPRYKSIGNSWAVPVARWIGERIQAIEDMDKK